MYNIGSTVKLLKNKQQPGLATVPAGTKGKVVNKFSGGWYVIEVQGHEYKTIACQGDELSLSG